MTVDVVLLASCQTHAEINLRCLSVAGDLRITTLLISPLLFSLAWSSLTPSRLLLSHQELMRTR